MIDYVVYGKIIIDTVHQYDGTVLGDTPGGGGPQGAFGVRLWQDSVGLLARAGTDLAQPYLDQLKALRIDLEGITSFDDLPTPHGVMIIDEQGEKHLRDRTFM